MRGLVEADCGGTNPLVGLTSRYREDRARVAEGVARVGPAQVTEQGLVREFLAETRDVASRPQHTFRMDSLLREMREMESRQQPPRYNKGHNWR